MIPTLAETVRNAATLAKNTGAVLIIVCVVFAYGMHRVYSDLQSRNEVLVDLIRESVRESRAMTDALSALSRRIEENH